MAHGDLTGNIKKELAEAVAQEQAAKAKSMAMATAELQKQTDDEPVELTTIEQVEAERAKQIAQDGEVEITSVDEADPIVKFKVNTDLENVTIGYGNTYSFERGRTYKAPKSVYWHLECHGLIWH